MDTPIIALPVSLDEARAHENFVISDDQGNIVALVPGEPNYEQRNSPPDDPEAQAIAQHIVTALNATAAPTIIGQTVQRLYDALNLLVPMANTYADTTPEYAAINKVSDLIEEQIKAVKGGA